MAPEVDSNQRYRRYDFYAHAAGQFYPKKIRDYYMAINAFFVEVLRSREVSREASVCQQRLMWWAEQLEDVENGKKP